ncbi:MAG: glycoside hydrolase family 140 protein [Bacteroidales bacterium]|nr:glycoside hydrolase family 140 protein [Bacteroidales bacterium]
MNIFKSVVLTAVALATALSLSAQNKSKLPWDNGRLKVSDNGLYIVHENGEPFFWLGNTSWLLPERLNREEVEFFLEGDAKAGYNVEQIQVLNAIPTFNVYGQQANDMSFDFDKFSRDGVYGYWEHLDYIVDYAASKGIYIAFDCIWGSMIKHMTPEKAAKYGKFLGHRYASKPNVIWMIGGDIRGDKGTESWDALARAIKAEDENHIMSFHPRGRTTSAWWFNDREWMDFNMFQSGHRRYGQRNGDGDYTIAENTEEDNWRYVDMSWEKKPLRPVIDGEPSYEDIPQGLHDFSAPRWQAADVRRYAYWAVFGGCFGHTYGHNSVMQFIRPGLLASFGAEKPWWDAMKDPGYNQMKYLKALMLAFPFTERLRDQSVISGSNGERYDRMIGTRGKDYLLVYNYTGRNVSIDLRKISGAKKNIWIMNPSDGSLRFLGEFDNKVVELSMESGYLRDADRVVIAVDSKKDYIKKDDQNIIK